MPPTQPRPFDVVIVGARCAGSPLATLLARRGLRVAVVERATFPSDTMSSHVFEADGIVFLDRLGVIDEVLATGAPAVTRGDARAEDFLWSGPMPHRPGDLGFGMSVRRTVLDPILAGAAAHAGAELHMGTEVKGLVENDGRVAGVRVKTKTGERELRARLVVGADGRSSTVAKLCGAHEYNVTHNERAAYWAYFENADPGSDPAFLMHRWADRLVLGIPCDSGLYQVALMPELSQLNGFRRNLEAGFMEHALSCEPVADALRGARRAGKILGCVRWSGFFREPSGPGWVLVGDAGHFKDPAAGRGIGDAFTQADTVAGVIAGGMAGSDESLDHALVQWGRRRDAEFAEYYWLAVDVGKGGRVPAVLPELLRGLEARGRLDLFFELYLKRSLPSKVGTVPRLLAATTRVVKDRPGERRAILAEVAGLAADEVRRRRLNRRPRAGSARW
jgi:2-polyprenyl-6-methoxyphenol hydroxylase-like FAD-dependent oxidoreductase